MRGGIGFFGNIKQRRIVHHHVVVSVLNIVFQVLGSSAVRPEDVTFVIYRTPVL